VIDFHTHTLFSDGELIPSELVRRASIRGYRGIGLTDHVDCSNLDFVVPRIARAAKELNLHQDTFVMPGAELTHALPGQIPELVGRARELGAAIVLVHGESPVEPVIPGTNQAAIEAGVDILAHPGFITPELARLAAERGVFLEITSRSGHSLTNGHVARLALEAGARLVIDTDTHTMDNIIDRAIARGILIGAGLTENQAESVFANNEDLFNIVKRRLGA
jgi:histidinol phosphatase-like PHP family hydrolase